MNSAVLMCMWRLETTEAFVALKTCVSMSTNYSRRNVVDVRQNICCPHSRFTTGFSSLVVEWFPGKRKMCRGKITFLTTSSQPGFMLRTSGLFADLSETHCSRRPVFNCQLIVNLS